MARIPLKDAVANAMLFAKGVLEPERTLDLRLEEVEWEFRNEGEVWLITLSMAKPFSEVERNLFRAGERDYKVFTVRCDTGEVVSMKIREIASVG